MKFVENSVLLSVSPFVLKPEKHVKSTQKTNSLEDKPVKWAPRLDMILQYAHHLAKKYNKPDDKDISVYAIAKAKLNARDYQELINPKIDLSKGCIS